MHIVKYITVIYGLRKQTFTLTVSNDYISGAVILQIDFDSFFSLFQGLQPVVVILLTIDSSHIHNLHLQVAVKIIQPGYFCP